MPAAGNMAPLPADGPVLPRAAGLPSGSASPLEAEQGSGKAKALQEQHGGSAAGRPRDRRGQPGRYERRQAALLGAGMLAAMAIVFLVDPAGAGFFPACPFRRLTGLLCPGCGATRALHQLLHGHLAAALALNPLLPLSLPLLGWLFLTQAREALGRPPLPAPRVARGWLWGLLALVLAFWVARNLPGWPLPQAAS